MGMNIKILLIALYFTLGTIGRVIDPQHAVQCCSNWGPIFGINVKVPRNQRFWKTTSMSGSSLMMRPECKWKAISLHSHSDSNSNNSSYPDIGIPNHFETDDYEVFQVTKEIIKVH